MAEHRTTKSCANAIINCVKIAITALLTSLLYHSIKTEVNIAISLVIVLCFNGCASECISTVALEHGHTCTLLNTVVVMYALISLVSGNSVQNLCDIIYTADDWVDDLINDGNNILQVTNIIYTGACSASGSVSFDDGINHIGYSSTIGTTALVLTTGNLNTAASSFNLLDDTTTINDVLGDADLDALLNGFSTYDASIIEFDIVSPVGFSVTFTYVFASEEYNEYVGSEFNDAFALWLNNVNVASIDSTAVAINNINKNQLSEYFVSNEVGSQIATEYDGLTVALATSIFEVTADEVVHVKLAIADAGDGALDSAIFIKPKSFDITACDENGLGVACISDEDCSTRFGDCMMCCKGTKQCHKRPEFK